jgi:hypothetical protein
MQCPQLAAHALAMQKNRIRGPVITLAAVVALGGGLWWANASQRIEPAAASTPGVVTTVDNAPDKAPNPPGPPKAPAPVQFPASATYSGVIAARSGAITVDITVTGNEAVAYVCDGYSLEVWLRGRAINGALALADQNRGARLSGSLQRGAAEAPAVRGTLWIGDRKWDFTAPAVTNKAPAATPVAGDDDN